MSAESIFNKPLSEKQKAVLDHMADRQAAGDDSGIDYSDIPPLTDEQLTTAVRGRLFYHADGRPRYPIFLEQELLDTLAGIAKRKGVPVNELVNHIVKKELAVAEVLR